MRYLEFTPHFFFLLTYNHLKFHYPSTFTHFNNNIIRGLSIKFCFFKQLLKTTFRTVTQWGDCTERIAVVRTRPHGSVRHNYFYNQGLYEKCTKINFKLICMAANTAGTESVYWQNCKSGSSDRCTILSFFNFYLNLKSSGYYRFLSLFSSVSRFWVY